MIFYILDTETNGLKPGYHEITEISIIRCSDRNQLSKKIKIKYPDRSSKEALEITGKSYFDLLSGDSPKYVIDCCNKFFEQDNLTPEHRCIVAHRASFDRKFCHALWESEDKQFPAFIWLDTIKLMKNLTKSAGIENKSFSLDNVLKMLQIPIKEELHSSASDARYTYRIWKRAEDMKIDYLSATKRIPHVI